MNIALEKSYLCPECSFIGDNAKHCEKCLTTNILPLAELLNRTKEPDIEEIVNEYYKRHGYSLGMVFIAERILAIYREKKIGAAGAYHPSSASQEPLRYDVCGQPIEPCCLCGKYECDCILF